MQYHTQFYATQQIWKVEFGNISEKLFWYVQKVNAFMVRNLNVIYMQYP